MSRVTMLNEPFQALNFLKYLFVQEKASVIIPCLNEEKTIEKVVKVCFKSPLINEVIVVDDGSADNSALIAKNAGAKVIKHTKNKGKGTAIITGTKAAKNSSLVFIDADFENVSVEAIEKLALPVLERDATICKAAFDREGGRVTELTAKPLLEFIFPEITLVQPLSGQFAVRKEFLEQIEISKDWGIDIAIVLDSLKLGEKIIEVNIGELRHKHRSLQELSKTAKEVTKTILQKAGFLAKQHKLIVFDFDKTLVAESSIELIAKTLKLEKKLQEERQRYYIGEISERTLTQNIAKMLKDIPVNVFTDIARKTRKNKFAEETLVYLKRMGYKLAVISFAYKHSIRSTFNPELFDAIVSPILDVKGKLFTGKVKIPPHFSQEHVFCKGKAIRALMKKFNVKKDETIAVGDSISDQKMFEEVGVPVALNSKKLKPAMFTIKSLPEVIIIAS